MRLPIWAVNATRPIRRELVSRIYLAVVAAAVLLMLLDTAVLSHGGSSLAGVLLLLVTLPWTPLLFALFAAVSGSSVQATAYGWDGWTLTLVAAVVSALVNAVLLGWAARLRRRRTAMPAARRNSADARS